MVNELQDAVHKLVTKFVERQAVVLDAMRDLRPDMILPPETKNNPKLQSELRRKYAQDKGRGYWGTNDEWEYRLHGIGCHLTNTVTGEIIGWDLGSLKRFDGQWFVDYIEWLITHDESDSIKTIKANLKEIPVTRSELRSLTFPILDELVELGLLKAAQHRYILQPKQ
jgi:hypothetical protein